MVHRREPVAAEALQRIRLRGGHDCRVIDISSLGALVESAARLLPGTEIDAQIVCVDARIRVRGRVVRAHVSSVAANHMSYHCAIRFERAIDVTLGG
jgi:hypothetical protein